MLKKKQFAHAGLRKLALKGDVDGVPAGDADRAKRVIAALNIAATPAELDFAGQGFRAKGKKTVTYAVALKTGARITFNWDKAGLANIDLEGG